jgi:branched-chain amino acid transport system ATP-binding protein
MIGFLGSSPAVFVGLTIVLFGFIALLTGQAIADTWRPARVAVIAAFGLAIADRFLNFALFGGELLSPTGFAVAWAFLAGVALLAWRVTLVRKMVRQYPWLYEATGLFGWRERTGAKSS